jgi:hypothetical protein
MQCLARFVEASSLSHCCLLTHTHILYTCVLYVYVLWQAGYFMTSASAFDHRPLHQFAVFSPMIKPDMSPLPSPKRQYSAADAHSAANATAGFLPSQLQSELQLFEEEQDSLRFGTVIILDDVVLPQQSGPPLQCGKASAVQTHNSSTSSSTGSSSSSSIGKSGSGSGTATPAITPLSTMYASSSSSSSEVHGIEPLYQVGQWAS